MLMKDAPLNVLLVRDEPRYRAVQAFHAYPGETHGLTPVDIHRPDR